MRLRRRWQKWLKTQREAYTEFRLRRARERRERREEEARHLMELNALEQAQTRALLAQLDPHTVNALKAVLREEALPTLKEEALTLARAELAEELAKAKERLEDQQAAYKEAVDAEVEDRVDRGVEQARADLLQDLEDRLGDLRQARNQARQERDAAEQQLLALLRQLLSERGRYLRNSYIEEFDQHGLNLILWKHGWRVRSRQTHSERFVKVRVDEARWQARTLFWLDTVPAEGVADEDPDPEAAHHVHQDVTPGPLALPEATGG
jgi:hypothetical protein